MPETVFNEGSIDGTDFRIESDGKTHMLFVDGGNDKVGINESAPAELLEISASSSPAIQLTQTGGTEYNGIIRLAGNDLEIRGSGGIMEFYNGSNDGDSSSLKLSITADGRVQQQNTSIANSCFDIYNSHASGYGASIQAGSGDNYSLNVKDKDNNSITEFTENKVIFKGGSSEYVNIGVATEGVSGRKSLNIMYDTSANVSKIQSHHQGSAYTPLCLQPNAGSVVIGSPLTAGNIMDYDGAGLNIRTANGSTHSAIDLFFEHSNTSTGIEQRIQFHIGDDATADIYGNSGYIGIGKQDSWQADAQRDSYMSFGTALNNAQSEKMRITADGRVGINETSPNAKLHIEEDTSGQEAFYINHGQSGQQTMILFKTSDTTRGTIVSDNSPSSTSYVTSSDERLKENIIEVNDALSIVNKIPVKQFNWIEDENDTPVIGYIGQELIKEYPQAVSVIKTDEYNDHHMVDQSKMVAVLMKAVQELSAKVEDLEKKNKMRFGN